MSGIRCPKCGAETDVLATRNIRNQTEVARRRGCAKCGYRFTTHERYAIQTKRGKGSGRGRKYIY